MKGILRTEDRARLVVLATGLALVLAGGFIPTGLKLYQLFRQTVLPWGLNFPTWVDGISFPILAAVFLLTLPRNARTFPSEKKKSDWLWLTLLLPFFISWAYGYWIGSVSVIRHYYGIRFWREFLWYSLFIPIGEELLFRGWLYALVEKLHPRSFFTLSNPLPASVWGTAIAFSVWHLQNIQRDPWALVGFQVFFTFWAGLWLGYLRWKSGTLWLPIVAHIGLNFVSFLH